jgi:hypothetical protein
MADLGSERYVSITSFRRDGTPVRALVLTERALAWLRRKPRRSGGRVYLELVLS